VRGQAKRDPALASAAAPASQAKAPSPLRSAGALHNRADLARFRGAVRERRSGRSLPKGGSRAEGQRGARSGRVPANSMPIQNQATGQEIRVTERLFQNKESGSSKAALFSSSLFLLFCILQLRI
jgi:hypothetical protein